MSAKITYNDFVKEIASGQTLTLKCANEKMEHDLVIEAFGGGGGSVPILEELTATANGEYTPSGDGFSKVTVAVPEVPEWDGSYEITSEGG
jgi:hypothetical protein